jgi:hypothetical protein
MGIHGSNAKLATVLAAASAVGRPVTGDQLKNVRKRVKTCKKNYEITIGECTFTSYDKNDDLLTKAT